MGSSSLTFLKRSDSEIKGLQFLSVQLFFGPDLSGGSVNL